MRSLFYSYLSADVYTLFEFSYLDELQPIAVHRRFLLLIILYCQSAVLET